MKIAKKYLAPPTHMGNAGIKEIQPIDEADWIWLPQSCRELEPEFMLFQCAFKLEKKSLITFHISGDERYELYLNGERISRGPDRSSLWSWSFASYEVELDSGEHIMEALVWRLGKPAESFHDFSRPPLAQLFWRGGFILKAEGEHNELLTTGTAPWTVQPLAGWDCFPPTDNSVFGIGCGFAWRGGAFASMGEKRKPQIVQTRVGNNNWGLSTPGWTLAPSTLPDRLDRFVTPGYVRASGKHRPGEKTALRADDVNSPVCKEWESLIQKGKPLTIPAHTTVYALWDLDNYYTGFPYLEALDSPGSEITWSWSESFYQVPEKGEPLKNKGNRDQVSNKLWKGFSDMFYTDPIGNPSQFKGKKSLTVPWWRSGRYILISVKTGSSPLTINKIAINEERYPLEWEGTFSVDREPELSAVNDLCVRGMQMCAHETFMDCPYYEQLMYVGDTRLELLTMYTMTPDSRLPRRCIELFDQSRQNWGFVNERFPSHVPQHCSTFSLIWTLMLRDFALWRNDPEFVKAKMIGMRSMMEHFEPYINKDGLLESLPGWPFTDWVSQWPNGTPPGGRGGVSGPINLIYLLSLEAAGELEDLLGDELLSQRMKKKAKVVRNSMVNLFWSEERGLFSDIPIAMEGSEFSEHSQALAILGDVGSLEQRERLFSNLLTSNDLKKASTYFSFYLFEAFTKMGRTDLIQKRLTMWKDMLAIGCKTPLEQPEPSRSDCHAWSSQPLFHLYASLAGIRPEGLGFDRVVIKPQPGIWDGFRCEMAHPLGKITLKIEKEEVNVSLPEGVSGVLERKGKTREIRG